MCKYTKKKGKKAKKKKKKIKKKKDFSLIFFAGFADYPAQYADNNNIYNNKYNNNCNKEKIKNKKESFLNGCSNEVFSLL